MINTSKPHELIGTEESVNLPDGCQFLTICVCFDDSDITTDYFRDHASASDDYVLAILKTNRQAEKSARRIVEQIPELARLTWKWGKEDYSMGHGYWLESQAVGHYQGKQTYGGTENPTIWYEIQFTKWKKQLKKSKFFVDATVSQKSEQPTPTDQPIIGEYKGHPTITLPCNGRGFTFGLAKARAILGHLEAIKEFAIQE